MEEGDRDFGKGMGPSSAGSMKIDGDFVSGSVACKQENLRRGKASSRRRTSGNELKFTKAAERVNKASTESAMKQDA
jgi:hypothetical protein